MLRLGLNLSENAPVFFEDGSILLSSVAQSALTVSPFVGKYVYRVDKSQSIRDNAGIPAEQAAGIQSGITPGTSESLTNQSNLSITTEAAALAAATSGTGTAEDPYIISLKNFNGTTGTAFYWNDPDADYDITLRDFQVGTNATAYILNNSGRILKVRNGNFQGTNSVANAIRLDSGGIDIQECYFKGLNVTNLVNVNHNEDDTVITFVNNKIDDSVNDWTGTCRIIYFAGNTTGGISFDIRHNDVDWTDCTAQPRGWLYGGNSVVSGLTASNNKWVGGTNFLYHNAFGSNPVAKWDNFTIQYNDIDDTDEECVRLVYIDGIEVSYNDFAHINNGSGSRLVYIGFDLSNSGVAPANVDLHNNVYDKQDGTTDAGDECTTIHGASGYVRQYNEWSKNATEDPFEIGYIREDTTYDVYNLVGDSSTEKIFSIVRSWDDDNWQELGAVYPSFDANAYVRYIYGDCGEWVLNIRGVRGVVFHDIYGDNSSGSDSAVNIDEWSSTGTLAGNIYGAGALPLDAETGGSPKVDVLKTGGLVRVQYIDESNNLVYTPSFKKTSISAGEDNAFSHATFKEGVIYIDFTYAVPLSNGFLFQIAGADAAQNQIRMQLNANEALLFRSVNAGTEDITVNIAGGSNPLIEAAQNKCAVAWDETSFVFYHNGSKFDLSDEVKTSNLNAIATFAINQAAGGANSMAQNIADFRYYPVRLSNAELESLTSV